MSIAAPNKPKLLILRWPVARLVLIALIGEIALATMNLSTMPVYLKFDRHFGETVIGFVIVAFLLAEAVLKGPMGHLADRYGYKKLMLIGPCLSVATAIASMVIPHTNGHPWEVLAFIGLRLIDGIGSAMLWPALFLAVGEAVTDGERQEGMSYLNLCYMLGIALAFPVGGIVDDWARAAGGFGFAGLHVGGQGAGLVLAGGLFAVAALGVFFFIPKDRPDHHVVMEEHGEFKFADLLHSIKQIPSYLLLSVVTFTGIGFPMAIFKIFPQDEFGFSESAIGGLIFPGAIMLAILAVPMSKFGERIGRVKAVHFGMAACAIGLWFIALGAFVPILRVPWILAIAAVPIGVGFLLAIPAWMASVSDIDPKRRGANIGAIMTSQGLGGIIGAPIGAFLYERLVPAGQSVGLGASYAHYMPFVGCAACVTAGWLLSLKILHVTVAPPSTDPAPEKEPAHVA